MKRAIYLLPLLLAASCGKPVENIPDRKPEETTQTKVELRMPSASDGLEFGFTESSRMVVNGMRSSKVELGENPARASFTFDGKVVAPYSAIYPVGVYSSMESVTVPARQKYISGKADDKSVIMLGYDTSEGAVELRHAMSFVRLTVNAGSLSSDNIYEITVSGASGEQLSGDFNVDCKNAALTPTGKSTTVILRDTGDGIPMGTPVLIALPARRPMRLVFDVADVNGVRRSFKSENSVSLSAGKIHEISFGFDREEGGSVLHLTPFNMLNAGGSAVGDHASKESRSFLVQMKSSVTEYNDNPNAAKPQTYSRIKKLPNGTYMLMWQRGDEGRSDNNGLDTYYAIGSDIFSWDCKGYLFGHRDVPGCKGGTVTRFYSCPELLVLRGGDVLAVSSFWVPSTYSNQSYRGDHGIAVKRSQDNGRTWSEESVVYSGQCWEPFLMELADGQIHCYFTEARPWISGSHSGTSLVFSRDGGKTWEPGLGEDPYRVMRKQWYHASASMYKFTDQMPVGVDLCGSGRLAFAMEDVDSQTSTSADHSVAVVYSPGAPDWKYLKDDEVGPSTRRDKLGKQACAPYLVQFPSGETVLSYSRENGLWPYCYRMGDADASNFGSEKVAMTQGGNWTGTTVDGSHCLLIASPYSKAIHISRYALNHDIKVTSRTVKVDGDNSEWEATDDALYFCKDASMDATMRVSSDENNLYILLEVSNIKISSSDYMSVFAGPYSSSGSFAKGTLRVKVGPRGLVSASVRNGSSWETSKTSVGAACDYQGTLADDGDIDKGWLAEISISLSALDLSKGAVCVGASFSDNPEEGVLCTL